MSFRLDYQMLHTDYFNVYFDTVCSTEIGSELDLAAGGVWLTGAVLNLNGVMWKTRFIEDALTSETFTIANPR